MIQKLVWYEIQNCFQILIIKRKEKISYNNSLSIRKLLHNSIGQTFICKEKVEGEGEEERERTERGERNMGEIQKDERRRER